MKKKGLKKSFYYKIVEYYIKVIFGKIIGEKKSYIKID